MATPNPPKEFVAVVSARLWKDIHRDPKIAKEAQEWADALARSMGGLKARIVKVAPIPTGAARG